MDTDLKRLDELAKIRSIAISLGLLGALGSAASILAFFEIDLTSFPLGIVLSLTFITFSFFLLFTSLYLISRVYGENKELKRSFGELHEVSHALRNHIVERLFKLPHPSDENAISHEQRILDAACANIAQVFSAIIRRECFVCVSLVAKEDSGNEVYFLWARSKQNYLREACGRKFRLEAV